jgi:hypothetical protein
MGEERGRETERWGEGGKEAHERRRCPGLSRVRTPLLQRGEALCAARVTFFSSFFSPHVSQ